MNEGKDQPRWKWSKDRRTARVDVALTEIQFEQLFERAKEVGRSRADLIRDALDQYLKT